MISVPYYGGPRDRKVAEYVATPPALIIVETAEVFGHYKLTEGIAGFEYRWTRPVGRWTDRLQKKLDAGFPKK
jgi:hypothetical protein